jgi:hypothetical protein
MFILRHFIDVSRAKELPLFTCFVDFSKAYDSVPREKLWKRLWVRGIRGRM